jgi:hypothetical protein
MACLPCLVAFLGTDDLGRKAQPRLALAGDASPSAIIIPFALGAVGSYLLLSWVLPTLQKGGG